VSIAVTLATVSLLLLNPPISSGQDSKELRQDFPRLFGRIGEKNLKADYVVVIDRSSSMADYWGPVKTGIQEFVDAVAIGDHLSVVTFAGAPRNESSPCLEDVPLPTRPIDSAKDREDLKADLDRLCVPTGSSTDLGDAFEKTLTELNVPGGNSLKVVFFFTDFIHAPPKGSKYPNTSDTDRAWTNLAARRQNELLDKKIFSYAILLKTGKDTGRDVSLGQKVFGDLQLINVNTNSIREEITRRKNELLRDRLRALVKATQSQQAEIQSLTIQDDEVLATLRVPNNGVMIDQNISDVEISDFNASSYREHLLPEAKDGRERTINSDGYVTVPVARVEKEGLVAWEGTPEISFTIKAKRTFMPENEIRKLNLDPVIPLTVSHKNVVSQISGGRLKLTTLIILGVSGVLAVLLLKYRYRPTYLRGKFVVRNAENEPTETKLTDTEKRTEWRVGNLKQGTEGHAIENVDWRLRFFEVRPRPFKSRRGTHLKIEEGEVVLFMNAKRTELSRADAEKRLNGSVRIEANGHTVRFQR
jgi:von Willebrand factor type A domain